MKCLSRGDRAHEIRPSILCRLMLIFSLILIINMLVIMCGNDVFLCYGYSPNLQAILREFNAYKEININNH